MSTSTGTHGGSRPGSLLARAFAAALVVLAPAAALGQGADAPDAPAQDAPDAPAQDAPAQDAPAQDAPDTPAQDTPAQETDCTDGIDNDGDSLIDCADADCFSHPACQPDGNPENTNERCSDWIDNDGDGYMDCEDTECQAPHITVCQGSWQLQQSRKPHTPRELRRATPSSDLPPLGPGMRGEDLIGMAGDIDGERNDILCSDGIDNDGDGRIDCEDFGCRFHPDVTVCQGSPDFRFSIVARAEQIYDIEEERTDTIFSRLQIRAFGPIPLVADSFYLLSMRAEKTPRLTFVMFQVPINRKGHYLNINSGTGGLSEALVQSAHKRLLMEPPYYVYNAFEQGNGVAAELGGPVDSRGRFRFRSFVAGGSGRFTGNIGGRFVSDDGPNYNFSLGGQLHMNLKGYYSRWDSPMLYTPVPLAAALAVGVKYDQRSAERYPAINVNLALRYRRLIAIAESYTKYVWDFDYWQTAYNIQAGYLLVPRRVLLAADFGEFLVLNPPTGYEDRFEQETQWRAAAHVYLWRNAFTASLLYIDRRLDPRRGMTEDTVMREINLVGQYRF